MNELVVLGDLATVIDCEHKTAPPARPGEEFGYSIGTRDLRGGLMDLQAAKRVSREVFEAWTRRGVPSAGDLILAREAPVGQVAYVTGEYPVCLGQRTVLIRVNESRVDSRYLHSRLLAPDTQAWMGDRSTGSTVAHFNVADVREIPLPDLPPIDEQLRIAGVLGAFDDLIETDRSAVRRVLDLSRALFSDVARKAGTEVRLGDAVVVNPDKVTVGALDEPLRYLDIAGLEDGSSTTPPEARWAEAPSRARRGAKEGDTLWATVRPNRRGHALLTPKPDHLVVSTGIAVLRPVEIGPAFLFAATDDELFSEHLTRRADGSAYPAVRANAFEDALIPLPDKPELDRFERTMWPIWQAAGELLSEATELQSIRDELLPLLMSGRITVDEAWEAVS